MMTALSHEHSCSSSPYSDYHQLGRRRVKPGDWLSKRAVSQSLSRGHTHLLVRTPGMIVILFSLCFYLGLFESCLVSAISTCCHMEPVSQMRTVRTLTSMGVILTSSALHRKLNSVCTNDWTGSGTRYNSVSVKMADVSFVLPYL